MKIRFIVLALTLAALPLLSSAGEPVQENKQVTVPPEGVAPYDPKVPMDKLGERITTDKFRFVVLGDTKHAKGFDGMIKYVNETLKPDFVLTTGDMVQAGGGSIGPGYWEMLHQQLGEEMRRRPWWPAIGNHEIAGDPITGKDATKDQSDSLKRNRDTGLANFKKFYNLERDYYSFSFRNSVFIALPYRYPEKESLSWLGEELKKASEAGKHIFVFNHSPFFTVGNKSKGDVPNIETDVTKLFAQYKVRAVFSGHDHIYYRTIRSEVPYMISAGGGASMYAGKRTAEALPEDVWYVADPAVATDPNTRRYIYHNGTTKVPDRVSDKRDEFALLVEVDGAKVDCQCLSVKGEKLDELNLAK